MSNSEEPLHYDRAEAIKAAIEARLAAFDRHRDELIGHLQKVSKRATKSLDPKYAWRHVRVWPGVI
jgi:hypothetical protein